MNASLLRKTLPVSRRTAWCGLWKDPDRDMPGSLAQRLKDYPV
jgi:hypothetical protein